MCFSAISSLGTFLVGLVFSVLLLRNPTHPNENKAFGWFFIFISLIQLMDFGFWMDLQNSVGINHILTIIGPILNAGQPLLLYLTKLWVIQPKTLDLKYLMLNCAYGIYFVCSYFGFVTHHRPLTTSVKNGHLKWPWLHYFHPAPYLIAFAANAFYLTDISYSFVVFLITAIALWLSHRYFSYHVGELWCFFGAFIPLIIHLLVLE